MNQKRVNELVLDERRDDLVSLFSQLPDDTRNVNVLKAIRVQNELLMSEFVRSYLIVV